MKTNFPGNASPFVTLGDEEPSLDLPCPKNHAPLSEQRASRRQLKVHPKFEARSYHHYVISPEIRLCGKWLASMGFACGEWVTVQPEPGRLVITLNKAVEEELSIPNPKF